jgi:predicted AAA+ superfamily ATPase
MPRRGHPLERNPLFSELPLEVSENLRGLNPWWIGQPGPVLPAFRRWPFERLLKLVQKGITPAAVLRGPRRVGKTVLLRQIIEFLLSNGIAATRILYVPFDELPTMRELQEPVLAISRWFEHQILGKSFNEFGKRRAPALLFFDEVQNLDAWAPQVKNLVDNHTVRLLVTGSSSLRIEAGRDSLAGRITTLDLGPLLLREIAELRFGDISKASGQTTVSSRLSNRVSGTRRSPRPARTWPSAIRPSWLSPSAAVTP